MNEFGQIFLASPLVSHLQCIVHYLTVPVPTGIIAVLLQINYLLTYDSYGTVHNRFHRGEWITWASGGEGALDTPGPLNGTSEAIRISGQ
jgi:hypothetical protein